MTLQNRRRTRIVLRKMQARVILHTTMLPLAALCVLTVVVSVLAAKLVADAAAAESELPNLGLLLMAVICLISAMAGAILFVAFRFSHRVAGPTYRIVESLKRMRAGDFGFQVQLRDGDFLGEIADQVNETLVALRAGQGGERQPPAAADAGSAACAPVSATVGADDD